MSINVNTFKGQNINTIILKAYVYAKEFVRYDGVPYRKYLTVISEIPEKEFTPRIEIPEGKNSPTYGVFIEVIGNGDIMRPSGRISLAKYQKYIETQGYTFIGTAPGVRGTTFEVTRIAAYQVIKKHMKGGNKTLQSKVNSILACCNVVEYNNDEGVDITDSLNKIRELVKTI